MWLAGFVVFLAAEVLILALVLDFNLMSGAVFMIWIGPQSVAICLLGRRLIHGEEARPRLKRDVGRQRRRLALSRMAAVARWVRTWRLPIIDPYTPAWWPITLTLLLGLGGALRAAETNSWDPIFGGLLLGFLLGSVIGFIQGLRWWRG